MSKSARSWRAVNGSPPGHCRRGGVKVLELNIEMRPQWMRHHPAASISDQESEQILITSSSMAEHQRAAKTGRSIYVSPPRIEIIQPGVKVCCCWRCSLCGISPTTGAPPVAATVAAALPPSLLQWSLVDRLATRRNLVPQGKYVQP